MPLVGENAQGKAQWGARRGRRQPRQSVGQLQPRPVPAKGLDVAGVAGKDREAPAAQQAGSSSRTESERTTTEDVASRLRERAGTTGKVSLSRSRSGRSVHGPAWFAGLLSFTCLSLVHFLPPVLLLSGRRHVAGKNAQQRERTTVVLAKVSGCLARPAATIRGTTRRPVSLIPPAHVVDASTCTHAFPLPLQQVTRAPKNLPLFAAESVLG